MLLFFFDKTTSLTSTGTTTFIQYSCYDSSQPFSAGTIIYNNGSKIVTSFCTTYLCNSGTPTDNATLWCNLGFLGGFFANQSCTGSCAVFEKINYFYKTMFNFNLKEVNFIFQDGQCDRWCHRSCMHTEWNDVRCRGNNYFVCRGIYVYCDNQRLL